MSPEITVVDAEPCPIASIEGHANHDDLSLVIGRLLDPVWAYLRSADTDLVTNHNVVLYKGDLSADGGAAIEVGVQVDRRFDHEGAPDGVRSSELPAARVARAIHRGPYNRLGDTHTAVVDWVRANGHTFSGISWEIYGDWDDDPERLETEVAYAIQVTPGD